MKTLFFPAWRSRLAARGQRKRRYKAVDDVEHAFARFFTPTLFEPRPGCRRRMFPAARTFWCFLWQLLEPGTACRAVVRKVQAQQKGHTTIDSNTSAYCQARARLPDSLVEAALQQSAQAADLQARGGVPRWDRPIKVVDATSFQMPDTAKNRERYRGPTGQKKGCGFPVARAMAIFSLASGAVQHLMTAACYTAELVMLKPLWSAFKPGDIVLGDRMYGCFSLLALFPLRGVDVVARLNQGRQTKLRRKDCVAPNDWRTTFQKSYSIPPYITKDEWLAAPQEITVRIIRCVLSRKGFRTHKLWIVTTLLDIEAYPAAAIAELYGWRWQMEVSFRDLKTTLRMEMLRCQTPAMIEKEIRMGLIAYNCLRALMAEAAVQHDIPRQRISFKGAVDAIRSFHPEMLRAPSRRESRRLYDRLLHILAEDALPLRPNRHEPRAVKRRPKPYPLLTKHRRRFKPLPHKGQPKRHRPHVRLT